MCGLLWASRPDLSPVGTHGQYRPSSKFHQSQWRAHLRTLCLRSAVWSPQQARYFAARLGTWNLILLLRTQPQDRLGQALHSGPPDSALDLLGTRCLLALGERWCPPRSSLCCGDQALTKPWMGQAYRPPSDWRCVSVGSICAFSALRINCSPSLDQNLICQSVKFLAQV